MRRALMWLLVVVALGACPGPALAESPHDLHFSPVLTLGLDLPLLSAHILLLATRTPSPSCSLCEPPGLDLGLTRALGTPAHRAAASAISDVGLTLIWFGAATTVFGGAFAAHGGGGSGLVAAAQDVTVVAEATLAVALVTDVVKLWSARRRPDAYFGYPSRTPNESLFSGHSALAAGVAASASTVAFLRDYRFKYATMIGGGALALGIGVLRISSLRHWTTDVVLGWAVGTAIGIALPVLLHPRVDPDAVEGGRSVDLDMP